MSNNESSTPQKWTATDLPDLTGQRWLITGASNGLGLATARAAAEHGAQVILAVRNPDKGEQIARTLPSATVLPLDLSSLEAVRTAAARTGEVDVLINNAGTQTVQREETIDGFEANLGVNLLGPFLFTHLVLPQVRRRVVILGSMAHKRARFDFDDPHFRHRPWKAGTAYAQSKLGDMLWGYELNRRLLADGTSVDMQLAHPGWSPTAVANPTGNPVIGWAAGVIGQPPAMGALPTLYAATQHLTPGSYIGPGGPFELRGYPKTVERAAAASDPDAARRVWEFASHEVGTA
ncbi:hypothetical protein BHE97_08120 [Aeromicrobium sp. PE09-221]|uniref:SDR family NAD(P)-dependent oxidoreductase n=1 Tax=Aeromicrobium sp. PE09-221 TaxID=1898043 RepID=UPI000B72F227|nr:SDR family NAD(P)-dependent oxidoreductase [Aeromicrobium sp. PE09-221]OUZ10305.1 hypothetical protein BHE97_08120 [Aeromicrobium sp. PE09-221]